MILVIIAALLILRSAYNNRQRQQAQQQLLAARQQAIAEKAYLQYQKQLDAQRKQEAKEQAERQKRANLALQNEKKRIAARKQAENIDLVQNELYAYMTALNREEQALLQELQHTSEKRAVQIQTRLTGIASKRAALSSRIANNENRIAKLQEGL